MKRVACAAPMEKPSAIRLKILDFLKNHSVINCNEVGATWLAGKKKFEDRECRYVFDVLRDD
jgi:hypothetical protein